MIKKTGFTLAEVLITLAIIGIVATLTIPTLVANSQKAQYVTGLKKAYSQWSQILIQVASDNGCTGDLKCTGLFDSGTTNDKSLMDELVKYIKISKICNTGEKGCFADNLSESYDASGDRNDWRDVNSRFITADGMSVKVESIANGCSDEGIAANGTIALQQYCGNLYIDVNGPTKGPNNLGRDIFYFYIVNGKGPAIYPCGGSEDASYGSDPSQCTKDNPLGFACAGHVIDDGWQMNY